MNSRQTTPGVAHSASNSTPIERLASWSVALDAAALPPPVSAAAIDGIVDTFGVMLAGAPMRLSQTARDIAVEDTRPGRATLIAGGPLLGPTGAALANGTAAHQLDFDDTHVETLTHASCIVLPAVLAAAEEAGVDTADLVAGYVAGLEVTFTLGRMLPDLFWRGWWPSSALGSIGAAAGATRAMRLDAATSAHALAIAVCYSFGLRSILGTDANPLGAGVAAQAGVQAARLAARGVLAPLDAIEHANGLAKAFNGGALDLDPLHKLGKTFGLVSPGVAVKRYPACSGTQAGAQAMAELIAEDGVNPSEVEHVLCRVSPLVFENLRFSDPANLTQAQFSMPFAIGCILAARRFGVDHVTEEWLVSDTLRSAMAKVEMRRADELVPHEWRGRYPEAAELTCRLRDGRTVSRTVLSAIGMPNSPLTEAQKRDKFLKCAAVLVDEFTAEALLRKFSGLLAGGPAWALLAPLRTYQESPA